MTNRFIINVKRKKVIYVLCYDVKVFRSEGQIMSQLDENQYFPILCPKTGNVIHELPALPAEDVLFQEKKKKKKAKSEEKPIEDLAKAFLALFFFHVNVTFNVKNVAEELKDDVKRVYDICNIFEAVGIITKRKVNTFCWLGLGSESMIRSLRQLKTIAEKEDLKMNLKMKMNLLMMTQKIMMLFLLLAENEGLTKIQLYDFVYAGTEQKNKGSMNRVNKILKVLLTLELIHYNSTACLDGENFGGYFYTGPKVERFEDAELDKLFVHAVDEEKKVSGGNSETTAVDTNTSTNEDDNGAKDPSVVYKIVDAVDAVDAVDYESEGMMILDCIEELIPGPNYEATDCDILVMDVIDEC